MDAELDACFARLRRRPDVESPELTAHDAADRLALEAALERSGGESLPDDVVVIGDRHGALTLGALTLGARRVRVHQDGLLGERALAANRSRLGVAADAVAHHDLGGALLERARLVLMQLPRSLDALEEIAEAIARHADAEVRVVAAGRVKHMTLGMNAVLERSFTSVRASLASRKARVLHAEGARQGVPSTWPRTRTHRLEGVGELTVCAHGAAFAGTGIDPGTRVLLEQLPSMRDAARVVDLACGTGVVSAAVARLRPWARVLATDQSAAAVASARATATANGVAERVDVHRADGLEQVRDGSEELILLNPPFHIGAAVHTGLAERLIADAGRALAPGGELWCVWNAHLRYRPLLERAVGPTEQRYRDRTFIVTRSTKR